MPNTTTSFTVTVHDTDQANRLALRFVAAALDSGHRIEQVFFYHDGVNIAAAARLPTQEDPTFSIDWPTLAKRGKFPLHVCVAAAQRRGLAEDQPATVKPGYELIGLGVHIAALTAADRVVTFSN